MLATRYLFEMFSFKFPDFFSMFFDLLNINCNDTVKTWFFSKTDSEEELLIAKKCFKFPKQTFAKRLEMPLQSISPKNTAAVWMTIIRVSEINFLKTTLEKSVSKKFPQLSAGCPPPPPL